MWYLFCLDRFSEWGILHRSTDEVTWNCAYKKAWSLAQQLLPPSWQCCNLLSAVCKRQ